MLVHVLGGPNWSFTVQGPEEFDKVEFIRCEKEILAARALVLPGFAEGLPVVIMEAMAPRPQIIGTLVAGIPR